MYLQIYKICIYLCIYLYLYSAIQIKSNIPIITFQEVEEIMNGNEKYSNMGPCLSAKSFLALEFS